MVNSLLARRKIAHAHPLVAETAHKMAEAVFEEALSKDNKLYRQLRESNPGKSVDFLRRIFVKWLAPELLGDARATLSSMLASSHDEALKSEIYEALIRDNVLRRGRTSDRLRLTH